jgi:mannonate dehydratase
MRLGIGQLRDVSPDKLEFAQQMGVEDVIFNFAGQAADIPLSGEHQWELQELVQLRNRVEDAGLRVAAIENVPLDFYEDIMLGRDGRREQMAGLKETVRNIGRADIPMLGYNWMPNLVWSSSNTRRVRGGARARAYDHADFETVPNTHGRTYTEEEFWDNYEWFLEEILPVAEEAGVKLCIHPDDPPVESLGGVPRLFRSFENYKRAMDLVESPNHGVEFGLGVFSEMGEDVLEVIEYFGERDEIFYVHFRDVIGSMPSFTETFVDDERSNFDELAVLRTLRDVGFDGVIIPDHVPTMTCDDPWAAGRGYTVGYLKGLLRALEED